MWQKRDDLQKLVRRWLQRVAVYPAKATAQIIPIAGRFPKTLTPGMQRSSAAELLWDSPAGASVQLLQLRCIIDPFQTILKLLLLLLSLLLYSAAVSCSTPTSLLPGL